MKYEVLELGHVSRHMGIYEADSKEEAMEKASEDMEGPVSLCHQCSSEWYPDGGTELIVDEVPE